MWRKLSSVREILWSGGFFVPSAAPTAGRYPHGFPLIQSQHQLPAVTHSWFVPDFTVAEQPASLSTRRLRSGTNGVTYASGNSCCFCPLLTAQYAHIRAHWADPNTPVQLKTSAARGQLKRNVASISFTWILSRWNIRKQTTQTAWINYEDTQTLFALFWLKRT